MGVFLCLYVNWKNIFAEASFGNEVVKTGNDYARTGNDCARNGNADERSGNNYERNGNTDARNGNEYERTGNEYARTGNETVKNGNEVVKTGNEVSRSTMWCCVFITRPDRFLKPVRSNVICYSLYVNLCFWVLLPIRYVFCPSFNYEGVNNKHD